MVFAADTSLEAHTDRNNCAQTEQVANIALVLMCQTSSGSLRLALEEGRSVILVHLANRYRFIQDFKDGQHQEASGT